MAQRRYKPGVQKQFAEGRMTDNRSAWLETYIGQMCIFEYPFDEDNLQEDNARREVGTTVRLGWPKNGRMTLFNITALTMPELTKMREFFTILFDRAEPVIAARDKVAQDALANGDDSFFRCYRQVPRLVVRARPVGPDDQGVHDGPEGIPEGDLPDGDQSGGVRRDGDELADGQPEATVAQDDGA